MLYMNIITRYSRVRYSIKILGYVWILELDTVEWDIVSRYYVIYEYYNLIQKS